MTYTMACFAYCLSDWDLTIPTFEIKNGVTYYLIKARIGEVCWSLSHRYRDFVELNNVLSTDHGFSKDLLPPKKYFGKQDEVFLETRRRLLEEYLRRTFNLLKAPMPRLLVKFLKMDYFDIFYILESIPKVLDQFECLTKDHVLQDQCIVTLTLLQAHAIRQCLKLPRPSPDIYKLNVDCSDVLELCGSLERVCIVGFGNFLIDSNLDKQNLDFDLSIFKSLKHLTLDNINLNLLNDASNLRRNMSTVIIKNCCIKSLADFIFCDLLHKEAHGQSSNKNWMKLVNADMSFNNIETVGDSVSFAPCLKKLDLRNNRLKDFYHLSLLQELQYLNAANNLISNLESARLNLSYLNYLDLSGNQIVSLKGLEPLLKLTGINLSFNNINVFGELQHISKLPLLSFIVLTGNPLSKTVDYRIKALLEFGDAHKRLQLDNEESTQKELDRVAVLLALKSVEIEKLRIDNKKD